MARCRIPILLCLACLWAGLLLFACSPAEEAPAPAQRVVKGKIPQAGPAAAPTAQPVPAPPPPAPADPPSVAPPAPVSKPDETPTAMTPPTPDSAPVPPPAAPADPSAVQQPPPPVAPASQEQSVAPSAPSPMAGEIRPEEAALRETRAPIDLSDLLSFEKPFSYEPEDKLDPFVAVFETQEPTEIEAEEGQPPKRVPQSPLEMVDLSQLKLTGVILAPSGNRALVQDASGKGYIVHMGTYLGNREGQVTRILSDRLIVTEKSQDSLGRAVSVEREIKLPKPPGEM